MSEISRNAACPCGSGLKYKKCCMGKEGPGRKKRLKEALLIAAVALVIGTAFYFITSLKIGGAIIGLGAVGAFGWYVFSNVPPPQSNSRSPGGIGFGR